MPKFLHGDAKANDDAMSVYSAQGFKVTGIPMDAHSFKDGAVHCLTHEIHTASSSASPAPTPAVKGGDGCSYADSGKYNGWGWNESIKQPCPPQTSP